MKRKMIGECMAIFSLPFIATATIYRIYDACSIGMCRLAWTTDSFAGWPFGHMMGGIGLLFFVIGVIIIPGGKEK